MNMSFPNLCAPAIITLVCAVIAIFFHVYAKHSAMVIFLSFLWNLLWVCGIQYLCSIDYRTVAWALVICPFVFGLIIGYVLNKNKTSSSGSSSSSSSSKKSKSRSSS